MSPIEQAEQIIRTHRIDCTGLGEVACTCRNPSGWMSWSDYYRHITQALADAGVLRDSKASAAIDSKATAAIDRVRALHYPNTTFGICVEDGDRWPCPTIRTLDEDPT